MGDSQRGQPSTPRETSDSLPNVGRQVGSSGQPHWNQGHNFTPQYSHVRLPLQNLGHLPYSSFQAVPEQPSFPTREPSHSDPDATNRPFLGPYPTSPLVQHMMVYPHPIPMYSPPQLVHHAVTTSSFGSYSAPVTQPLRPMQLPSYHHYPGEQNMAQHHWTTSGTAVHTASYLPFAPMPASNTWGQPLAPTMNMNSPQSPNESYGFPATVGPSIPPQYVFTSPQSHFSTSSTASGHGSSRDTESGAWWQFPSIPNAPSTSGPTFHASADEFYRTSFGSAREKDSRPVVMPSQAFLPPSPSQTVPIPPRRSSQPQSSAPKPTVGLRTTPPSPFSPTPSEFPTQPSLASPTGNTPSGHTATPVPRSQWAMWVGNVPADATNEELFQFFSQSHPDTSPDDSHSPPSTLNPTSGGVTSVFLIGRSNCAFVNFESQQQLESATTAFNGRRLREGDARGPRLVCRVRKQDDDGHAGVTGQRQSGIHSQWVRERETRARKPKAGASPTLRGVTVEDITSQLRFLTRVVDATGRKPGEVLSDPGSFESTTSSFLSKHFPQRYFILKSLSQVSFWQTVISLRMCSDFSVFPFHRKTSMRAYERAFGLLSHTMRKPSTARIVQVMRFTSFLVLIKAESFMVMRGM